MIVSMHPSACPLLHSPVYQLRRRDSWILRQKGGNLSGLGAELETSQKGL